MDVAAALSAEEHRWRGLAVLGVDGSTLRVPDTPENDAYFGSWGLSQVAPAFEVRPEKGRNPIPRESMASCVWTCTSPGSRIVIIVGQQ